MSVREDLTGYESWKKEAVVAQLEQRDLSLGIDAYVKLLARRQLHQAISELIGIGEPLIIQHVRSIEDEFGFSIAEVLDAN